MGWTRGTLGIRLEQLVREAGCLHFCHKEIKKCLWMLWNWKHFSKFSFLNYKSSYWIRTCIYKIPRWLAQTLKTKKYSPRWFWHMSSFQQHCSTSPSNSQNMHSGNGINFKCSLITAEGYHGSQEKQILKKPTAARSSLTLALRMGTDDSVRGRSVLGEGNAASVLLRKDWQLTARFLDWMMEFLILTDLNSTNRNVTIFSGRFNSL